jgi:hypothetical protein
MLILKLEPVSFSSITIKCEKQSSKFEVQSNGERTTSDRNKR